MEDPIQYIVSKIQNYFLPSVSGRNATSLIKVHNANLKQIGDVSFPLNPDIWRNYFKTIIDTPHNNIFALKSDSGEDPLQVLINCSQNWTYPLAEVKIIKDRCAVFLDRKRVTEILLNEVLNTNTYGTLSKNSKKRITLVGYQSSDQEALSEYRAKLVHRTLKRVLRLSDWTEDDSGTEDGSSLKINVVSVVTKCQQVDNANQSILLRCGTVLDPQNGKLAKISPESYISLRSTDMRLMAMHKYGIRVKDDKQFCELFQILGEAAVTVDLLEVKPSSLVNMIRSGQGSTKGASFILYNSARLETLLRTFEEKVTNGTYEKLPALSNIDLSLLSSEEEWELIYGYIFAFPHLITRCIENFESGNCGVHYLIKYLDGLVSTFSVYYRRVRILTETRTHLMPHVYARIYLLKALRNIFNTTLALLDIKPVDFM